MRYNLESTLPIHAFQPLVRHSPFKQRMTLEGGGGGIIESIGDAIGGAVEGIGDAIGGIAEGAGDVLASVDDFVGDTVPGGWGTIAAIAVPYAAPYLMGAALTAGQAAALAAGTSAVTGAVQGKSPEDILKGAALAGVTSYGLGSLGEAGAESLALPSETPYIDMADGAELLTPDSFYIPDEAAGPYMDGVPPSNYQPPASYIPDEASPYIDGMPPVEAAISAELDLGSLYQDLPDGATQLGYSPDELAAITSSSAQPTLSSEAELRRIYEANMNDLGAGTSPYGEANELPSVNELAKDPFRDPRPGFFQDPVQNITNRASDALDYLQNAPENTYKYLRDTPIKEMGSDLYDFAGRNKLELGLGALALSSMGGQQPQEQGYTPETKSKYTGGYGPAGKAYDPYLLKNRVDASNVYEYKNPYDRYDSVDSRYAQGGEVKHFAFGGISNALTRAFQPIEKAIIRPIGQAVPFVKEVAPYAGILAAPFIGSPIAAAGIGGLASGFGRPGSGFDMKRALMGGIAAYGASTLGAGLEAAGTENYAMPDGGTGFTSGSVDDAIGAVKEKGFFRDTGAMGRGIGNLLTPSTYDQAAANFGTQAGTFKTGVPIVMGTSGMMAIDEANKMREEAELAAGPARQSQADMLARIAKGRKRAEQAVRENPYQYAMGGQIDDELGGDYSAMGMDQGNLQKGLFGMGYAEGGTPRFLSGGGDGMSDSIPATISGTQEARLADGEFVIPADVVSHLGNGSSKAGAKQLYSMMDRVRKARTGNEKQGRQIKPNKMMPA